MSSFSHFLRFWGVVFGASILLIPQLVFAANPVSKTNFTKDTSTGTALWERQISSCAPTSNVTPRATGDCDDSAPSVTRTSDNNPVYATVVVNNPSTVDCADFEGETTGVSVDAADAAGVVNDSGVLHFDLATEYGQSYDTYEVCAETTPEMSPAVAGEYFVTKGWSWNDNLGWVSFVCDDSQFNAGISCGDITYKTSLNTSTGVFSGYAWGDATGWIQFGWTCPVQYSAAQCDDNRVTLDFATGELSGYAWSENVGWFNFDGVNINNSDLTSLWQYSSTTVDWDVEVYYGKPYTELFADCTDAYKVHVRFKDPTTGTYLDPEISGYTVSVSDWTEDSTIAYDQLDSSSWNSTYYSGIDCPVNSDDVGYWQEEDVYHYVIEGFTVAVLDSTNAVVLQKDFTWDETQTTDDGYAYGHFAFYPVVTSRNLCVDYSGTKKPYITAGAGTGKTVTSTFDKRSSAVTLSNIELIGRLFSPTGTLLYSTTSVTTEATTISSFSGTTYSYTTTVDIDTEGGNGCYVITYCLPDSDEGTTECVEVPITEIPRYVPYGVGVPQFETRGTQSTETDVDTAIVTRNTLYTTLKKVLGTSTGKTTDSTLKSADLDGDARTANDSAEFLGGNLLYFSGGADVYFDDSTVSAVDAGMNFTDVDDLVSSAYAITWTEPVTVVVEGGDVYILDNLWGDAPLGIIVLDDGAGSYGNVYIGKDVTNVKAVIYADGLVTSYDPDQGIDSDGIPLFSTPTRDEALTSQLYFVGSIISGGNNTSAVDSDGDGLYSDDELDLSDEEKAANLNWMREFKLYPETSADGNPEDYDGDGTVEDCSTVTGYPYINASVDCEDAFSSESGTPDGDLIVRDDDRLAAGVTEDATSLYSVVDFLPFYLRYQAPDSALPIFRSTGGGGAVGQ